jgi:hypothetical protein
VVIIFSFIADDSPSSSHSFSKFYLIFYIAGYLSADAAFKPGSGRAIVCDFRGDLIVYMISQSLHTCELPKIDYEVRLLLTVGLINANAVESWPLASWHPEHVNLQEPAKPSTLTCSAAAPFRRGPMKNMMSLPLVQFANLDQETPSRESDLLLRRNHAPEFGRKAVTMLTLLLRARVDAMKSQSCATSTLRARAPAGRAAKRQVFPHHLHQCMPDCT